MHRLMENPSTMAGFGNSDYDPTQVGPDMSLVPGFGNLSLGPTGSASSGASSTGSGARVAVLGMGMVPPDLEVTASAAAEPPSLATSSARHRSQASLSPVRRKPKPCLSPKSKLGGMKKASLSTGNLAQLKRNKISFGDIQIKSFEKDVDSDDEEHRNELWFSKTEMKSIRKDLKQCIKKGEISRGLEPFEKPKTDQDISTKEKRLNHMYSILDTQQQQRMQGVVDDVGLSMLSRTLSSDDLRKARRLANMDSKDAFKEYEESLKDTPALKSSKSALVLSSSGKAAPCMIRSSSRNALDNFRKSVQRTESGSSKVMSFLGRGRTRSRNKNANATFDLTSSGSGNKKKDSGGNMLLKIMADKKKATEQRLSTSPQRRPTTINGQAGMA